MSNPNDAPMTPDDARFLVGWPMGDVQDDDTPTQSYDDALDEAYDDDDEDFDDGPFDNLPYYPDDDEQDYTDTDDWRDDF